MATTLLQLPAGTAGSVTHRAAVAAAGAVAAAVLCARALHTAPIPQRSEQPSSSPGTPALGSSNKLPVGRLQHVLTPAVAAALASQGFAVVDGVFGSEWAARLRSEVDALRPAMHRNCTHLVRGGATSLLPKQHIQEAELLLPETQAAAPLCSALQHDATLRTLLSVLLPRVRLQRQAIKLQWNEGSGGCFPCHVDSDVSVDGRLVTAIWYLNPGWCPEHGGQLRLYPWPQGPPVDIAPLEDRLVLFSSRRMLHRVLPSFQPRCCFTIWLSGASDGSAPFGRETIQAALAKSSLSEEEAWQLLVHPDIHLHALKSVYQQEWVQSLEDSHPPSPERDEMLERFLAELAVVQRALRPLLPHLHSVPPNLLPSVQWL